MSDTREDTSDSSGEEDPPSRSRRWEGDSPRAPIALGRVLVVLVMPMTAAAFLIVLLTLYLSLRW